MNAALPFALSRAHVKIIVLRLPLSPRPRSRRRGGTTGLGAVAAWLLGGRDGHGRGAPQPALERVHLGLRLRLRLWLGLRRGLGLCLSLSLCLRLGLLIRRGRVSHCRGLGGHAHGLRCAAGRRARPYSQHGRRRAAAPRGIRCARGRRRVLNRREQHPAIVLLGRTLSASRWSGRTAPLRLLAEQR